MNQLPTYFTYSAYPAFPAQQSWQLAGTSPAPQYSAIGEQLLAQIPPSYLAALPPTGIYPGSMQYPFSNDVPSQPPVPVLAHIVQEISANPPAQTSSYSGVVDNSGSSSHSLQSNPSSFSSAIIQNQEDEVPSRPKRSILKRKAPSKDEQNREDEVPSRLEKSSSKPRRPLKSERDALNKGRNIAHINFNQPYESFLKEHIASLDECIETGEGVDWCKGYRVPLNRVYIVCKAWRGKEPHYKVSTENKKVDRDKLTLKQLLEASPSTLARENQAFPWLCKKQFTPQVPIKYTNGINATRVLPSGATCQVTIAQDFYLENQQLNIKWTEGGKQRKSRIAPSALFVDGENLDTFRSRASASKFQKT